MNSYDVIVVGAGPSGTISSYTLARLGFKVLLVDKERFPRYKPCGGALTLKTVRLLKHEGLFDDNMVESTNRFIDVYLRNEYVTTIELDAPIFIVDRAKFDFLLLKKAIDAGVTFHANEYAIKASYDSNKAYLLTSESSYTSEFIVGADGVNSKVALTSGLRNRWRMDEIGIASQAFLYTTTPKAARNTNIMLFFGYIPYGYGWVFPLSNKVNVGIGTRAEFSSLLLKIQSSFYKYIEKRIKGVTSMVTYHPLSLGINSERVVAKGRILLVGDAAGLADPWSGEGVYYAILSGLAAALVIGKHASCKTPDLASSSYNSLVRSILKELEYAAKISRLFYKSINLSVRLLKKTDLFSNYLSMLLSGRLSYSQLYRKLTNIFSLLLESSSPNFRKDVVLNPNY